MWGCVIVGTIMAVLLFIFMDNVLMFVGASNDTWEMTKIYLIIVICSGPFVLISNCYANVIRAEGQATKAMMGQLIGNLLNVILDPIFIFVFRLNIAGAAIATVIGNLFGACYYILYFLRGKSILSISIKDFTWKEKVCSNVLAIGVPSALGSILMSISQIIINSQMSEYGDMAIAAIGVAMKVMIITGMVCMGLGQGIQPLLGYCVGAKLWERFHKILKFSLIFSFLLGTILTILCYLFTNQIVSVFLIDNTAFDYAVEFSHILLTTSFLFGVFYVMVNVLQAMGEAASSFIISISRQGLIFIPALFLLKKLLGLNGLVWAQPIADIISLIMVIFLYSYSLKRRKG